MNQSNKQKSEATWGFPYECEANRSQLDSCVFEVAVETGRTQDSIRAEVEALMKTGKALFESCEEILSNFESQLDQAPGSAR